MDDAKQQIRWVPVSRVAQHSKKCARFLIVLVAHRQGFRVLYEIEKACL